MSEPGPNTCRNRPVSRAGQWRPGASGLLCLHLRACLCTPRSAMPYSVVLVDDHKIMRDGIKTILERTPDFRVVGDVENGSDAVSVSRKMLPDLVVMDIGLPGMNGIEATSETLRHCPATKVMILSM